MIIVVTPPPALQGIDSGGVWGGHALSLVTVVPLPVWQAGLVHSCVNHRCSICTIGGIHILRNSEKLNNKQPNSF